MVQVSDVDSKAVRYRSVQHLNAIVKSFPSSILPEHVEMELINALQKRAFDKEGSIRALAVSALTHFADFAEPDDPIADLVLSILAADQDRYDAIPSCPNDIEC